MRTKWIFFNLAVLAAALLLAVGCGDWGDAAAPDGSATANEANAGEGSGSDAGSSAGKAKFIEEANRICVRRLSEVLAQTELYVQQNKDSGRSVEELQAESVDQIFLPGIEAEAREIRELEAPAGEEARVGAFLDAMEKGIEETKRKEHVASNIENLGHEYEQASQLAEQYGMTRCSLGTWVGGALFGAVSPQRRLGGNKWAVPRKPSGSAS